MLSIAIVVLFCISLVCPPVPVRACGPFFPKAIFTFTKHPDFPLDRFAAGDLGILQPSYARFYLVIAYRYLTGEGFSAKEQGALLRLWRNRIDSESGRYMNEEIPKAQTDWFRIRNRVAGVPIIRSGNGYLSKDYGGYWNYISVETNVYDNIFNCLDHAFENAAKTLQDRMKRFGAASPAVKSWVLAQDAVFRFCGQAGLQGKIPYPEPASPSLPEIVRADRAYQIAAAHFYDLDFSGARELFTKISKDSQSPWKATAQLMVARATIRNATLKPSGAKQLAGLKDARALLDKILADHSLREVYRSARALRNLVDARLDPEMRVRTLAQALVKKDNANLKSDLEDYTALLDSWLGTVDSPLLASISPPSEPPKLFTAKLPKELRNDPLTDWIVSFQSRDNGARLHCVERWRQTKSVNWLLAALEKSKVKDAHVDELIEASRSVGPESPAFATLTFHRVRLESQSGAQEAARTELDAQLAAKMREMPRSTLNLLLALRVSLAKNIDDLLSYGPRVPAGTSSDEDDAEIPIEVRFDMRREQKAGKSGEQEEKQSKEFDLDSAWILTRTLPTSMLVYAAESANLPRESRAEVAKLTWVRAQMLGDEPMGLRVAPLVGELEPKLSAAMSEYISVSDSASRRFQAILTILRSPGLEPLIVEGIVRREPLDKMDSYGGNWWCSPADDLDQSEEDGERSKFLYAQGGFSLGPKSFAWLYPGDRFTPPAFLSEAEQIQAGREWARMVTLGNGAIWLAQQTLDWAKKHPNDSRVPEALHLANRAMRYGCVDHSIEKPSKEVFDLLHRRYPNSEWTKKTPYWFK
jgi:hypothetical protein